MIKLVIDNAEKETKRVVSFSLSAKTLENLNQLATKLNIQNRSALIGVLINSVFNEISKLKPKE